MNQKKMNLLYIAFAVTLLAVAGSLYFSEVLGFAPCVLCWYQRIAMYPLVIILAVGIIEKNKTIHRYILPFSLSGLFIAFYHNLLYYNVLPERISPCVNGVSCLTRYIDWFGFISIPLLSFISFLAVTICMLLYKRYN